MSLSNIYVSDTKASFKDISCNSLATEALNADSVTAVNNITSTAGDFVASVGNVSAVAGNVSAVNANLSGRLNLSSKYFSPSTALPATIAIDELQGVITCTGTLSFPDTLSITLTNPNIFADSTCLVNMGPSAETTNSTLNIGVTSVNVGSVVIIINNNSGGAGVPPYVFSYLIC